MSSLLTRDQMPDWLKSTYRTLDRSEKEILAVHNSVAVIEKKTAELTRALRGEAAVLRAEEEAEKEKQRVAEEEADELILQRWPALRHRKRVYQALVECCREQLSHGSKISHAARNAASGESRTPSASSAAAAAAAANASAQASPLTDISLTYGEVGSFVSFSELLREVVTLSPLNLIPRDGSATFSDIGCGNGKGLAYAALLPLKGVGEGHIVDDFPRKLGVGEEGASASRRKTSTSSWSIKPFFSLVHGVEILPELAEAASRVGTEIRALAQEGESRSLEDETDEIGEDNQGISPFEAAAVRVEVGSLEDNAATSRVDDERRRNDLRHERGGGGAGVHETTGWAAANVVWACSLCFSDELLERVISLAAQHLRPGAVLVTLKVPASVGESANNPPNVTARAAMAEHFQDPIALGPYQMSWGSAVAYCLVKRGNRNGPGVLHRGGEREDRDQSPESSAAATAAASREMPPPPSPVVAAAPVAGGAGGGRGRGESRAASARRLAKKAATDEFLYELD